MTYAHRRDERATRRAHDLKILFVTNEGGGLLAGRSVEAVGLELTVSSFTFETLVRFRRAPSDGPVVNRAALDRAVEETERYDGILAEAPEAVLLHFVRAKRGLRPLRWLVNTVQLLSRVEPLRAAIARIYGEDPLALVAADPGVRWIVTTRAHVDALAAAGLPPARIVLFPSTTALQELIMPTAALAFDRPAERELPVALAAVEGAVLAAGTNNRDLETLARAADIAARPIHVLTDRRRASLPASRFLVYHDVVPLAAYVTAVARARLMVVPLRAGDASCGQQTVAIAQRVRTLVLASDVPAMEGYIADGVSGLLVAPEDPSALALAIDRGLTEPHAAAMIAAGFERDARDGRTVEGVLRDAFLSPLD